MFRGLFCNALLLLSPSYTIRPGIAIRKIFGFCHLHGEKPKSLNLKKNVGNDSGLFFFPPIG